MAAQRSHPSDFSSPGEVGNQLLAFERRYAQAAVPFERRYAQAAVPFERRYAQAAVPFEWKLTRRDLACS